MCESERERERERQREREREENKLTCSTLIRMLSTMWSAREFASKAAALLTLSFRHWVSLRVRRSEPQPPLHCPFVKVSMEDRKQSRRPLRCRRSVISRRAYCTYAEALLFTSGLIRRAYCVYAKSMTGHKWVCRDACCTYAKALLVTSWVCRSCRIRKHK